MYRYYIFDIKNKFKNDNNLYRLLKTLYTLNLKYINYGELIYNDRYNRKRSSSQRQFVDR